MRLKMALFCSFLRLRSIPGNSCLHSEWSLSTNSRRIYGGYWALALQKIYPRAPPGFCHVSSFSSHATFREEVSRWPVTIQLLMCMLSRYSQIWLFETLWTVARRAPLSMDSPGKNTVVCCHFLLQEIFPIHRWRPPHQPAWLAKGGKLFH